MRSATIITETDIAELRRLRTEHGLSITQLSARFRLIRNMAKLTEKIDAASPDRHDAETSTD